VRPNRRLGLAVVLLAVAVLAGAAGLRTVGIRAFVAATQDHSVHRRSPAAPELSGKRSAPKDGPSADGSTTRVVVLVEENHESSRIIGSRSAPFLNSLAAAGTLLSSYYGISHPSLPNYLSLLGGDTFGIRSDCTRCRVQATNLVDQLEAAHISWRGYFEGLPRPCSDAAFHGGYAKKHNPFMYFDDIRQNPARCSNVVPFEEFDADVAAGRLPRFALVVPNQDHDMHSGSVATGDTWARRLYDRLSASAAWRADTRLVVTFDEGASHTGCCDGLAAGGHIATIVAGPHVPRGVDDRTTYDHYSLLASIESLFGLDRLGYAGAPSSRVIGALR
jgi:hypothetical protein